LIPPQQAFQSVISSHRRWLDGHDGLYGKQWEQRLAADEEAALCEAVFRDELERRGCTVAPNEDLKGRLPAPDFLCHKGPRRFFVEVKCLEAAAIEKCCGGDVSRCSNTIESGSFGLLNDAILKACKGKTAQVANLPAPRVLAIGTFHSLASIACVAPDCLSMLLTGTLEVAFGCNPKTGALTGTDRVVTHLSGAVFARPKPEGSFGLARQPISALLVGGLAVSPPRIFGLLHPSPAMQFDPSLLGRIPFCRLLPGHEQGRFSTEWINVGGGSR
jgi:hypothetical protein